jgi:hypothetical protein
MGIEHIQQVQEMDNLLKHPSIEARRFGDRQDI